MDIDAPSHWRCVDFISDLHLHPSAPQTLAACTAYLQNTSANALFILGDLFEVWVGDDCLEEADAFQDRCIAALQAASRRMAIFIMVGNRDFLMGPRLMAACGATALPDPSLLNFGAQRWLLTHGDALCLDDVAYQAYRTQVRDPAWQEKVLALPLAQRKAIARELRAQSEVAQQDATRYIDLDTPASLSLLSAHGATHMIHGHTHRPGQHTLAPGCTRTVLSDWDLAAQPPRADVLRLSLDHANGGSELKRLDVATAALPSFAD